MNPDITIHVSLGPDGGVASRGASQHLAAAGVPSPMALADLQASGAGTAPAPLSQAELSAASTATEVQAGQTAPRPMAIEELTSVALASAPEPDPVGAFGGIDDGPPVPQAIEGLATGAEAPAEPADIEEPGSSDPPPRASGGRRGKE